MNDARIVRRILHESLPGFGLQTAALAAVALLGVLSPAGLALAIALSAAIAGTLAWRRVRGEAALERHLASLENSPVDPPAIPVHSLSEMAAMATRLARIWSARHARADALGPRSREILDALAEPVFLLDRSDAILAMNRAAALLFPGAPGALLAERVRNPALLDAVREAASSNTAIKAEFTLPLPTARSFEAAIQPLPGEDGARVVSLRDITAAKRTDSLRADFVANASHELRTPLAALRAGVETLQGAAKDDPAAREQFLSRMADTAARMTRLVDDLLSLSRIEMREHTPPSGTVALDQLAARIVEEAKPRAAERRTRLVLEADPTPVIGDEVELAQMISNLIDNAIKYGRAGGTVRVTVGREENRARLLVQDEGEGIAREHLPRLTERFYRVDPGRSRSLGGTGLGLAIVKHIVIRHDGLLAIESEIGAGTIVTVRLPLADFQKTVTQAG